MAGIGDALPERVRPQVHGIALLQINSPVFVDKLHRSFQYAQDLLTVNVGQPAIS